jgi:hypothetical protein
MRGVVSWIAQERDLSCHDRVQHCKKANVITLAIYSLTHRSSGSQYMRTIVEIRFSRNTYLHIHHLSTKVISTNSALN